MLTVEQLREDVDLGAVDTVVAAFTDMQGRLMGKRLDAEFFLEEVDAGHAVEGCNYLLALDMEMDPLAGYDRELGARVRRLRLRPDLATLRRVPWLDGTALVLCDVPGTTARRSRRRRGRSCAGRSSGRERGFTPMSARSSSSSSSTRATRRRARSTTAT